MFEEKPIPKIIAICMIALALGVDIVQFLISFFIPIVGDLSSGAISFIFGGIYALWFKIGYGVNFSDPKKLIAVLAGGAIEFIGVALPEVDLPGLTIAVAATIFFAKLPEIIEKTPLNRIPGAAAAVTAASSLASGKNPMRIPARNERFNNKLRIMPSAGGERRGPYRDLRKPPVQERRRTEDIRPAFGNLERERNSTNNEEDGGGERDSLRRAA